MVGMGPVNLGISYEQMQAQGGFGAAAPYPSKSLCWKLIPGIFPGWVAGMIPPKQQNHIAVMMVRAGLKKLKQMES